MYLHVQWNMSGAQEQFWPDALPDATSDSQGESRCDSHMSPDVTHIDDLPNGTIKSPS